MTISSFLRPPGISAITLSESLIAFKDFVLNIELKLDWDFVVHQAGDAVVMFGRKRDRRRWASGLLGSSEPPAVAKTVPPSPL